CSGWNGRSYHHVIGRSVPGRARLHRAVTGYRCGNPRVTRSAHVDLDRPGHDCSRRNFDMNISNPPPAAGRSGLVRMQQTLINPVVRLAWRLRLPIPGDALLETTGRRTGLPRHTPVCDGLDGDTFWLIAQRGHDADWVRNIKADPRVRTKLSGPRAGWRTGTAHILEDDDPRERR